MGCTQTKEIDNYKLQNRVISHQKEYIGISGKGIRSFNTGATNGLSFWRTDEQLFLFIGKDGDREIYPREYRKAGKLVMQDTKWDYYPNNSNKKSFTNIIITTLKYDDERFNNGYDLVIHLDEAMFNKLSNQLSNNYF